MVKIPLVGQLIEEGARLINLLNKEGLTVSSAFWLFDEEDDNWALVIALPFVDEQGPLPAYQKLGTLMGRNGSWVLDLSFVSVWGPSEWRFKKLLDRARSAGQNSPGSVQGSLPPVVLEDSYIYRA